LRSFPFKTFVISFLVISHLSLASCACAEAPQRIISLAPNITEILFALGAEDRVVGVSSFCDYPEGAKQKPKVGGLSNPSLEAVVSLKPDLVFLTKDGNPKAFEERLRAMKINTVVLTARKISDLPDGIRKVGTAVGAAERAERLASDIEKRIREYEDRGTRLRVLHKTSKKPKALFIIWPDPLIVAGPGTTTDEALTILGTENIAATASAAYPKYSIEEILRRSPDIIFIGKGNGMDQVSDGLLRRLKNVPAVKNKKVFYVSDYLYRLGPRTIQGVDELAGRLQEL
jgi:iron complex transport system substrate-binding protein